MCQYCVEDDRRSEPYYAPDPLPLEVRRERTRLERQMKALLKTERALGKQAEKAAAPYKKKATKVHKEWVKLYEKFKRVGT